ncbi:MAG: translation initiation factor IF-2 [Clostridia bacterium]
MTKVKLKDATKELLKGAGDMLGNVSSMRKNADELAQVARKLEAQFVREEEQRRAEEKQAEQQRLARQHTKAYTMPDTDEMDTASSVQEGITAAPVKTESTPAKAEAEEKAVQAKVESPAKAVSDASASTAHSAATAVPHADAHTVQETVAAAKPVEQKTVASIESASATQTQKVQATQASSGATAVDASKPADNAAAAPQSAATAAVQTAAVQDSATPPVQSTATAVPATAETSAAATAASAASAAVTTTAATTAAATAAQAAPAAKPAVQATATATATAKPAVPAAGNAAPRPMTPTARPMGQAGMQAQHPVQGGRPMQGGAPRPAMNPQGPYGRPANPQGPYGRPANPQGAQAPQGPYGRPANPQGPYGRPANPQGAAAGAAPQGSFAPQGSYGRPANPQGPYGRPANPQGPYGRPANGGAPSGGGARPAGNYGRPAGGPGMGRPPMGGAPRGAKAALEMTPAVEKERVSNYDPNKKNYVRQHDPERVAKNRKQLARESFSNGFDDDMMRGGRRRNRKPSAQQLMAPIKIEKAFMTADTITVKDLTERIGKPAGDILKKLLMLGMMANINSEMDFDTASLVCSDFGVELEMNLAKTAEDVLIDTDFEDSEEVLVPRPPVVTIMGHVDHGKTSLLDYIRHSHVTTGEAGGITQHIGAYTVTINDRLITFLDTPGHEAFTAMRARGAQSTDIAVLVVAADDGVMPQTIEAIHHAKAAGVPIIVAINKVDKPSADPSRVMQDLTTYELVSEAWGGDTIMAPVSAATGEGVDDLLEMIVLQADMLQLRSNPNRMAKGVIIEAKLDKSRGPVTTVLLQNGTLHVGDNVVAGMASGRVRAMVNDKGERVMEAGASMPVEVTGFTEVPSAGDDMMAVADDHLGRQVVQERRDKQKAARVASSTKVSLDNLFSRIDQSKLTNLNLIIKADVQGSVEAVKQALEKLSNDEVRIRVLHSAVGAINKDDVNLASAFDAIIIGFNIRPDNSARDAAEREGVDVRLYRVIYQAIEDIQKASKGLLEPEFKEVLLGHAEVRSTFRITGAGTVAGCYVQDGKLQRNAQVRLLRDNVVVFEGKLSSLKRFKDDAKEVATGYECGVSFDNFNEIKEGDIVECFLMEEIER